MKKLTITFVILIILTATSAIASNYGGDHARTIILILAGFKFLIIAFYFMELKKAHGFWKFAVVLFYLIFLGIGLIL